MNNIKSFLTRQRSPNMRKITILSVAIHWFLVFKYCQGFYFTVHNYLQMKKKIVFENGGAGPEQIGAIETKVYLKAAAFTFLLVLAVIAYFLGQCTEPGHISYGMQSGLSAKQMNRRLLKRLAGGYQPHEKDILDGLKDPNVSGLDTASEEVELSPIHEEASGDVESLNSPSL